MRIYDGVSFRYDPLSDQFTKLVDLDLFTTEHKFMVIRPYGNLVEGFNGNLFGMNYNNTIGGKSI